MDLKIVTMKQNFVVGVVVLTVIHAALAFPQANEQHTVAPIFETTATDFIHEHTYAPFDGLETIVNGNNQQQENFPIKSGRADVTSFKPLCGIRNTVGPNAINIRTVNLQDENALFGEFPWTVAFLKKDGSSIGAGSLIHPKIILTAFHIVQPYLYRVNELKIRAGEWNTQSTDEELPYQERNISRITGHEDYRFENLQNDFALIELEEPFQLDAHINTVCLPTADFVPSQRDCVASGWGKTSFGSHTEASSILKKVPVDVVDFEQCQEILRRDRLGPRFQLHKSLMCAGGVEGIDTCQGDGGAPLVCPIGQPNDDRYALNGIVSWGLGCKRRVPGVYANVATARDWIDAYMIAMELDTNYYDA